MMQAIRVNYKLDSDTVRIPELREFVGRNVEIIVLVPDSAVSKPDETTAHRSLIGSVLRYDDPFQPAVPPLEWDANQ